MKKKDVKTMVGVALLMAIVIVLQVISGVMLKFGSFSLTLCLVPIVIGGIIYGPKVGTILGFVFGVVVVFNGLVGLDVGTQMMLTTMGGYTAFMTVILCLVKATVAGLAAAWGYKTLKNKNKWMAVGVALALCPIVNTGIFCAGFPIFLMDALKTFAGGENLVAYLFLGMISYSFLIELGVCLVLIPAVHRINNIYELYYIKNQ